MVDRRQVCHTRICYNGSVIVWAGNTNELKEYGTRIYGTELSNYKSSAERWTNEGSNHKEHFIETCRARPRFAARSWFSTGMDFYQLFLGGTCLFISHAVICV